MSRFNIYLSVAVLLFACSVSVFGASTPAPRNPNYEAYIAQWSATAQAQQAEYGIPASITLAQGLLESAAGQSELATKANNHFGIKCHSDWQGGTFYKKAEKGKECFRSYARAEESFRDHSLFLKRKRYEVLFTYKVTDYKAWARGLRECGYATDPKYPQKLIQLIETYELDKFDKVGKAPKAGKHQKPDKSDSPGQQVAPAQPATQEKTTKQEQPAQTKKRAKVNNQTKSHKPRKHPSGATKAGNKPAKEKAEKPIKEKTEKPKKEKVEKPKKERTTEPTNKPTKEPASKPSKGPASKPANKPAAEPASTPAVAPIVTPAIVVPAVVADSADWSENELRTNTPYAEHASGTTNGRRYIVAQQGDSWGSLAYTEGMEESTLRHINEADATQALRGGDKVYFMPKRSKADKQHPYHIVKAGETAWSIAQEYGMKVGTLYRLNGLTEDTPLTEGQYLYLR